MNDSDLVIHNLQVKANELILEKNSLSSSISLEVVFDNLENYPNGVISTDLAMDQFNALEEVNRIRLSEIEYSLSSISTAISEIKKKSAIEHAMSLI